MNDEDPFAPKVTEAGQTQEGGAARSGNLEPLISSSYVVDL